MNTQRHENIHNVAVIFLQYSPDKYLGCFDHFKDLFKTFCKIHIDYIIVDNFNEGEWEEQFAKDTVIIGGDNSQREFSGWIKGLKYIKKDNARYDLIMFVNDTFMLNIDELLPAFNDDIFPFLIKYKIVSGVLYFKNIYTGFLRFLFFKPLKFTIHNSDINYWVRTNLFIVPANSVIYENWKIYDPEIFFPNKLTKNVFKNDAPISKTFQNHIINYLCPQKIHDKRAVWHSCFTLNEDTYNIFITKAMSIINEMCLVPTVNKDENPVIELKLLQLLNIIDKINPNITQEIICLIKNTPNIQLLLLHHFRRIYKIYKYIIQLVHFKTET